ncbi:MAG: DUF1499 domain-containing protein [Actinomycetota bacterium]|nr:DUF1499 domain-containing protein [Rubrobacter sp.]MDQ3508678.1 DUF1499 domain-containing protein [Actinomycetota bacterium]
MEADKSIERTGPKSARAARSYDVSAERLASAIEKAIRSLRRWEAEASSNGDIRAVRSTRLLKFKDDVTVKISGGEEASEATFESESRIGKSDLGQNPKNLEELLSAVDRELDDSS